MGEIKHIHKYIISIIIILSLVIGCKSTSEKNDETEIADEVMIDQQQVASQSKVTIALVGDIMFHQLQLEKAYSKESEAFDFSGTFDEIKPYIEEADYAVGNLETTFSGPIASGEYKETMVNGYSGYPKFTTPDCAMKEIADCGFDLLTTANNHCLDYGYEGLKRTIDVINDYGLNQVGTVKNETDKMNNGLNKDKRYFMVEIADISFAMINYTYGTNGNKAISNDSGSDDANDNAKNSEINDTNEYVNHLGDYSNKYLNQLYEDIKAAENSEADYVMVFLHFGLEYMDQPSDYMQKEIAYEVIRNGGDFVIGTHPHVVQPIELVDELDGIQLDEPKVIMYSLGNFISSQHNTEQFGGETDLGAVVYLQFKEDKSFDGLTLIPIYTLWQKDKTLVVPIEEDGVLQEKYNLSEHDKERLKFGREYVLQHMMYGLD